MAMDLAVNVDLSISGAREVTGILKWLQSALIMEQLYSSYLKHETLSEAERDAVKVFQSWRCMTPSEGAASYYHLTRPTLTTWERMKIGTTEINCREGSPVHRALMAFEALGLISIWRSGSKWCCRLKMPEVKPIKKVDS